MVNGIRRVAILRPVTGTEPRFFFVHVMKTGGATFRRHIEHNFRSPGAVYPDRDLDGNLREANILVERVLHLPPERRAAIRAYTGHFPFVIPGMIDPELITLTMLRDPVARTISYLKHCRRYHERHHDLPLEAIYEDPFSFPTLIHDHQVKIFAMTRDDRLESYMDVIEIDDARRRVAESNLERVDVVGLHEGYDDFLAEMHRRFGWDIRERSPWRVGEENWDVSTSFRRRI
ncbi:MAG: hypothetical protein QOF28_914, partial [Actinomycetota bacterium]|nr:hypothetical protein [Actinomycetota bacterium]